MAYTISKEQFDGIQKDFFVQMKLTDTTVKRATKSPEYEKFKKMR